MPDIVFGSAEAAAIRAADKSKQPAETKAADGSPLGAQANTYKTALLATCRTCGGVVGIRTNTPEHAKDAARDGADWIRAGFCVNDMPVEAAKAALANWCECPVRKGT